MDRDVLGEQDDGLDPGGHRFEYGALRRARWDEEYRCRRAVLRHGFLDTVVNGNGVHVLTAFAGGDARDDLRPAGDHALRPKTRFAPGDALDNDSRRSSEKARQGGSPL